MFPILLALSLSWDGPLLPIFDGKVILTVQCADGQQCQWSPELQRAAHGLRPGDVVMAGSMRASLGTPICVVGECGGNYVSLPLSTSSNDSLVAFPPELIRPGERFSPVRVLKKRDGLCRKPPRLHAKASQCISYSAGIEVQTEVEASQKESWDVITTYVRVEGGDTRWTKWPETSQANEPFAPIGQISGNGTTRILWRQAVGINGPAFITVVISRTENGVVTFGRHFSGGGQPCD